MRIVIVGSGGVGGYLAARMLEADRDVHLVARGKTLEALKTSGLRLLSPIGNVDVACVQVSSDASTLSRADLVLVCVKLWDTEDALEAVAPVVTPKTILISFQNGVRAADALKTRFSPDQVLGAVCYISSRVEQPGHIVHTGALKRFVVGEDNGLKSARLVSVASCFQSEKIDFEMSHNVDRAIWEKFVFLVGLSAATAGMRNTIGVIRANPQARTFVLGIMKEVTAVADRKGVKLDPDFANLQLKFIDTLPADMTASMYVDLMKRQRLELPWLSSDVVRLGEECGVPTPLNAAISDLLSIYTFGGI